MKKLNEFIMARVFSDESILDERYNLVIQILSDKRWQSAICNYILVCARRECLLNKGYINPREALDMMDSKFCMNTAYQYIEFMQNSHEYVDYEYRR